MDIFDTILSLNIPTNLSSLNTEHDSFASTPWTTALVTFVEKVLAQHRVKLIGVCFGHQIIGRAMGAKVGRNVSKGWEVSVTDVDLTTEGKEFFKEGKDVLVSIILFHPSYLRSSID